MTVDQVILAMQLLGTTETAPAIALVREVETAIAPAAPAPDPSNAAALEAERAQWAAIAADERNHPGHRAKAAEMVKAIDAERGA